MPAVKTPEVQPPAEPTEESESVQQPDASPNPEEEEVVPVKEPSTAADDDENNQVPIGTPTPEPGSTVIPSCVENPPNCLCKDDYYTVVDKVGATESKFFLRSDKKQGLAMPVLVFLR